MTKSETVLAVLSAKDGFTYQPVQVQKLFFLIEQKIPELAGHFHFTPYDYGPFDADVYRELHRLGDAGLVEIISTPESRWEQYRLTPDGTRQGASILSNLPKDKSEYVKTLADFVTRLSFAQLVGAIYKAFPAMKENSIFRG